MMVNNIKCLNQNYPLFSCVYVISNYGFKLSLRPQHPGHKQNFVGNCSNLILLLCCGPVGFIPYNGPMDLVIEGEF